MCSIITTRLNRSEWMWWYVVRRSTHTRARSCWGMWVFFSVLCWLLSLLLLPHERIMRLVRWMLFLLLQLLLCLISRWWGKQQQPAQYQYYYHILNIKLSIVLCPHDAELQLQPQQTLIISESLFSSSTSFYHSIYYVARLLVTFV